MPRDLEGLLVVTLEQAVAAPYASCKLADAGARVIKLERAEGDFARRYDTAVKGLSAYFVWLNRGKQSVRFDLKDPDDQAMLKRMLARADVFIQNLAPGATARAGFASADLRAVNPRLITCDISGYGNRGRRVRRSGRCPRRRRYGRAPTRSSANAQATAPYASPAASAPPAPRARYQANTPRRTRA